jgi:hypothetical protein
MTVSTQYMAWSGYNAASASDVFIPAGPWISAANITAAKGYGELRGRTGNFQIKPAVQVANDVRSPGSATQVGAAIAADGVSDPNGEQAVTTGTSKYIRVGWLVSNTSGSTLSFGAAAGIVELITG